MKSNSFFSLYPNYEHRVFGLDLIRAIAIINVVIGHAGWMYQCSDYPWIKLINGVELFFVLSGFLIGGILIRKFQEPTAFGMRKISSFWIRRWFRTLPNYYLILLLNVVIVYFGFIKEDITQFNWKFFFFLQNFKDPFYGFFWESWSLSIEEWFYFSFPILLVILYNVLKWMKIPKRYIFLITVFSFWIMSFLLRFFIASQMNVDDFWAGVKIHKVVIYHLDGIALGLLAAYIRYWHPHFWYKYRNITFVFGFAISYLVLYSTWEPNAFSSKVYKILFQSIGCFLLLPRFETIKSAPKILTKIVTHISLVSYSMYLINLSLVASVISSHIQITNFANALFWYIVYWSVVLILSTLLYKYFEKPITDLRDKVKI